MELSPERYMLLRSAIEALAAPPAAPASRIGAPRPGSVLAWPRRVPLSARQGWERVDWWLPGCLQVRVIREGRSFQLDRSEPGRFEGLIEVSSPSPVALLLDGRRSVPPACVEYETRAAGLEGLVRPTEPPHVFLCAPQAARLQLSGGESQEVALDAGEVRRVPLAPTEGRDPIVVRWGAIEVARIELHGGDPAPPTARLEVTPAELDLGRADPQTLTIRVHRSGRGGVHGLVLVGIVPHTLVVKVHLAADDAWFEHTLDVRAADLPERPRGRLRVSFLSNSRLLDNRLQEAWVAYGRPVLRRSLPRVLLPAGRRAAVTMRCTHSAGARVELLPQVPDSLRDHLEVRAMGSALVFTAHRRSRPGPLEDVVVVVDVLSGLKTVVPVRLEGDAEVM